jgi:hypothetical protein
MVFLLLFKNSTKGHLKMPIGKTMYGPVEFPLSLRPGSFLVAFVLADSLSHKAGWLLNFGT